MPKITKPRPHQENIKVEHKSRSVSQLQVTFNVLDLRGSREVKFFPPSSSDSSVIHSESKEQKTEEKSVVTAPVVFTKDNGTLVKNYNIYVQRYNDQLYGWQKPKALFKGGYCHGFSWMWLCKMASGTIEDFKSVRDDLASYSYKTPFRREIHFEVFFEFIKKLHFSDWYFKGISQSDTHRLFSFKGVDCFSGKITSKYLKMKLNALFGTETMVCVGGWEEDPKILGHSIALFFKGKNCLCFDPASRDGEPKVFDDSELLTREVIARVFLKPGSKLEIELNIVKATPWRYAVTPSSSSSSSIPTSSPKLI